MLIYLLRHGLTEYNAEKRYQGQRDIPLSAAGRAMLCRADISPKTVYITPLCRTRQTAEVLFPGAKLVEIDGNGARPGLPCMGSRQLRKPLPGRRDQGCFL